MGSRFGNFLGSFSLPVERAFRFPYYIQLLSSCTRTKKRQSTNLHLRRRTGRCRTEHMVSTAVDLLPFLLHRSRRKYRPSLSPVLADFFFLICADGLHLIIRKYDKAVPVFSTHPSNSLLHPKQFFYTSVGEL